MKDRIYQKRDKTHCSKCNGKLEDNRAGKQRYCKKCHAASMRENRPKQAEYSDEQKKKANARSYAHVYVKRGKINKKSCEVCGSENSQIHHDDYNKPTNVRWFCREHHLEYHKSETLI